MNPKLVSALLIINLALTGVLLTPQPVTADVVFTIDSKIFQLNGNDMELETAPYVKDGRIFLPLIYSAEALGIENDITWDEGSQTATIIRYGKVLKLQVGNDYMLLNGAPVPLGVLPEIKNDRLYIPLGLVANAFGDEVNWDESTQTLMITKPAPVLGTTVSQTDADAAIKEQLMWLEQDVKDINHLSSDIRAVNSKSSSSVYSHIYSETLDLYLRVSARKYKPPFSNARTNMLDIMNNAYLLCKYGNDFAGQNLQYALPGINNALLMHSSLSNKFSDCLKLLDKSIDIGSIKYE